VLAIVILLAVVAAFLYALSEYLQQRAAWRSATPADTDSDDDRAARLLAEAGAAGRALRRMARERVWFVGWGLGTLAFFVQAAALNLGSVSVVQSLQVTTLIFTLPLAGIGQTIRPRARDWLGAGTIAVGLAVFLAVRGVTPGASQAHRGRLLLLLFALAGLVLVLAAAGALRSGPIRATLFASAAGVSLAATATTVKLTSDDLVTHGVVYTATDWPGYALALGTAVGVILQQVAFTSGRLPVAATAMTIANPLVGTVLAVIGFNESLPHTAGGLAGLAVGAALVCAGVYVLAHSPLLAEPLPDPADAPEASGLSPDAPDALNSPDGADAEDHHSAR
jgi:drug/metabolite transporter (DMT)-like permease